MELGRGDPALCVNSAGEGPLSAEWMLPKALWLKEEEPLTYAAAHVVCEKQDYINYCLTGRLVGSGWYDRASNFVLSFQSSFLCSFQCSFQCSFYSWQCSLQRFL